MFQYPHLFTPRPCDTNRRCEYGSTQTSAIYNTNVNYFHGNIGNTPNPVIYKHDKWSVSVYNLPVGYNSYIYMYIYIYIYMYICIYIYMYIYIYVYIYLHTKMWDHTHAYIYTYEQLHAHLYIYIYIHTLMYTHIYTYIYTHKHINTHTD